MIDLLATVAASVAAAAVVAWLVARTVVTWPTTPRVRNEMPERPDGIRCTACGDTFPGPEAAREHVADIHNLGLTAADAQKVLEPVPTAEGLSIPSSVQGER